MGNVGYRDIRDPLHAQDTILGLAMVSDEVKTKHTGTYRFILNLIKQK